jgi:hypothetical protein
VRPARFAPRGSRRLVAPRSSRDVARVRVPRLLVVAPRRRRDGLGRRTSLPSRRARPDWLTAVAGGCCCAFHPGAPRPDWPRRRARREREEEEADLGQRGRWQ